MPLELTKNRLTPRQERFAYEYVRLGNKVRAGINAGFSEKSAKAMCTTMTDPDKYPLVAAFIEKLLAEKRKRMAATEERMTEELARMAYLDIGECYKEDGSPLPLDEMPEDARRALTAVKTITRESKDEDGEVVSTTRLVDVVAASKLQALKQLADLKGIGRGTGSTNINLAAAQAAVSVEWSSLKEPRLAPDNVVAAVEEAKALALAKEAETGAEPSLNGTSDNGHA